MKKFGLVSAIIGAAAVASANTYNFTPNPVDLNDLDHYYAYSWGLNFNVPTGHTITGATLTIKDIWDWTPENDILYVQMLDNPSLGVKQNYDNQGGGNYFGGQGTAVGTWSDPVGGHSTNFDLKFDLKQLGLLTKLNQYAADGRIGFGFDPDCHYYNKGVNLCITTEAVPEPATMGILAASGIAALLRRKRK